MRKQEQSGVWAVPPLELVKRKRARQQAKRKSDVYVHSSAGTSEKLLHLFARLHTAATRVERDDRTASSSSHMLTWINSRLPRRVIFVFTKEDKNTRTRDSAKSKGGGGGNTHRMSALAQHPCGVSGVKSLGRMSRRGVPEVEVTVSVPTALA